MKKYTINAKNKSLGRVASEAAAILRGKKEVDFRDNRVADVQVNVVNIDEIIVTGRKTEQKTHKKYSGYPGGLKFISLGKVLKEKGRPYVFKKVVLGMLPKNKLQKQMIKNLIIK
ncbi:MAG: 50S ribosomal protein L13 [Patescibacteria group bacterium]